MISARGMRHGAADAAARLPALLAAAEPLAASMILGAHGRRRSGHGEEFWQYRPAVDGDEARAIDWRRSAQSDTSYVREREWQTAQNVQIWVDRSQSMGFDSHGLSKGDRAAILALALAMVLVRGGERVGLLGHDCPPKSGGDQIIKIAHTLAVINEQSYGAPQSDGILRGAQMVMISDFMGDLDAVKAALTNALDHGVRGAMVQVLDPAEASFPFSGRSIFEARTAGHRFETNKASALRQDYLVRLAERKDALETLAHSAGWSFATHVTDQPPQPILVWLHTVLSQRGQS